MTDMNQKTISILVVEDDVYDQELLFSMLSEIDATFETKCVETVAEAQQALNEKADFDLILLDLNLPDSDGLNTVLHFSSMSHSIPVVVMTGFDNEEVSLSAIQAGAQDYLVKGKTDSALLSKTIRYALGRFQTIKKINEVSERQKVYVATHDVLTGLPNQQLFLEQLQNVIKRSRTSEKTFSLLMIKIHEIDYIEKFFGYSKKIFLLKKIVEHLREEDFESCNLFYFQDNTFAIILESISTYQQLIINIKALQQQLNFEIQVNDHSYSPYYSIGACTYPFDGDELKSLLGACSSALEKAEEEGFNHFKTFDDSITQAKAPILHNDILRALERDEFALLYQPQIDLRTGKLYGLEALLRWNHTKMGVISPTVFIPLAESYKLINPIGEWIVNQVCNQVKIWKSNQIFPEPFLVHINISIQQLQYSNIFSTIKNSIEKYSIDPGLISLELTESVFITQPELVIAKLQKIKKLGVHIAIDDFGQGYSSLAYLRYLPIDTIKLDIDFVQRNNKDDVTRTIVEAIIKLAHNLNFKVVAEGVETKEQLALLIEQGCDVVQGFYFSKPKDIGKVENILLRRDYQWFNPADFGKRSFTGTLD